jgi:hypothetical protein
MPWDIVVQGEQGLLPGDDRLAQRDGRASAEDLQAMLASYRCLKKSGACPISYGTSYGVVWSCHNGTRLNPGFQPRPPGSLTA